MSGTFLVYTGTRRSFRRRCPDPSGTVTALRLRPIGPTSTGGASAVCFGRNFFFSSGAYHLWRSFLRSVRRPPRRPTPPSLPVYDSRIRRQCHRSSPHPPDRPSRSGGRHVRVTTDRVGPPGPDPRTSTVTRSRPVYPQLAGTSVDPTLSHPSLSTSSACSPGTDDNTRRRGRAPV